MSSTVLALVSLKITAPDLAIELLIKFLALVKLIESIHISPASRAKHSDAHPCGVIIFFALVYKHLTP